MINAALSLASSLGLPVLAVLVVFGLVWLLYHEYKRYRDQAKDYDRLKAETEAKDAQLKIFTSPEPDRVTVAKWMRKRASK